MNVTLPGRVETDGAVCGPDPAAQRAGPVHRLHATLHRQQQGAAGHGQDQVRKLVSHKGSLAARDC